MKKIKERAKNRENRSKGSSIFNLPEGVEFLDIKPKMRLDIIPYRVSAKNHPEAKKGELWYERTFLMHRNVGLDSNRRICPKTIGKDCPICKEFNRMRKEEDADKEVLRTLKPSERQIFNVIDLDNPKKGVQILTLSCAMFGDLLEEEIRDGEDDVAAFSELKGGKTLVLRFRKEKIGSSVFWECAKITFKDRKDYDESILDEVVDLDKALIISEPEALEKEMNTGDDGSDDDEDEEDVDTDDASDFDEDDEDDDGDDEPKSKKSKKSKRSKKDEEEEDEDEEDDSDSDDGEEDSEDEEDDSDDDSDDDGDGEDDESDSDGDDADDDGDEDDGEDEDEDEEEEEDEEDDDDGDADSSDSDSEDDEDEDDEDEEDEDEDSDEPEPKDKPIKGKWKPCKACGKTGVNSKGGVCKPCNGKGWIKIG